MTKEQFVPIMEKVAYAYEPQNFSMSAKSIDAWFEFFHKFDVDIFDKVVSEYIMENPKPPAISDFYGRCKKISGFRSQAMR